MKSLFSIRLKTLRIEKGLTQEEVGKFLKVNKVTISYYESGFRKPTLNHLEKLGELFNVSLDYLLGHDSLLKEDKKDYMSKDLALKYISRSEVLKDFLLEDPNNVLELEKFIKKLKS